jgi:ADP-heptose:LPS heptosyltransferase
VSEPSLSNSFIRTLCGAKTTAPFQLPGTLSGRARLLAIDAGDLADMLFHMPLLQGLHQKYPGIRIDFLLPQEHAPLAAACGLARQCLVYSERQLRPLSPGFWALQRSLRKNSYDAAVVMSLVPQRSLAMIAWISGAVLRMGPSHPHSYPAINFEVRTPADRYPYRGMRPLSAAVVLGMIPEALPHRFPLPDEKLRRMQQLVHFNKPRKDELLIGVDPGLGKSGHGISLPNLHFLVRQLNSHMSCRILPLTDPGNMDRWRDFEAQLPGPPPGLPRENLLDMVLLLTQCDLFVSGNTDLFHFAVAEGVPAVGLFTRMDEQEWDPGPRPRAKVLRVAKGQRVDIDTLMEVIEAVTQGTAVTATSQFADTSGERQRC